MATNLVKSLGLLILVATGIRFALELLRPALVPMGVVLGLVAILSVVIRGRRT
jgi:hypothetical protein